MDRVERRRREGGRRKRADKGNFFQRNWMKVALSALGVVTAVGITASVLLSRDSKPPPIEPTKVESVLSIAKQRIGECYDSAYKYWQTSQGTIDCDTPLTRMFKEISRASGINFGEDTTQYIRKLQGYLAQDGVFMAYDILPLRDQAVPDFYIARIKGKEERRLQLIEGERDVSVGFLGEKIIGSFVEERVERGVDKGDITRDGTVYIQQSGLRVGGHNLWNFYETRDFEQEINAGKSLLRSLYEKGDMSRFNATFAEMIIVQEWRDAYDSIKRQDKTESDFVELYVAANTERLVYHGGMHVQDSNKNISGTEKERRAALQELLVLPAYNPEYMLRGYETLANASAWMNLPSDRHGLAGRDVMNCVTTYVDQFRDRLPQVDYSDVTGDIRQQNLALILKLPQLTSGQMYDAAQVCWRFYSKN